QYDNANRLVSKTAPPVTVTSPQQVFAQDFSTDASGLAGDGITSGHMAVSAGRLVATTYDTGTAPQAFPVLQGSRSYAAAQPTLFHSEVTTTNGNGQWFLIGAENNGVAGGANTYRRMTAFFASGGLYAAYYDQNNAANPWVTVFLGTAKDNTSYNVDVQVDANGATLNVYEVGKDRSSGFSFTRADPTWGDAHTTMCTLGNPGQPANPTNVDNVTETTAVTSTSTSITTYAYDALGNKTDVTRASGTSAASTTHYSYDAAGRLISETGSAVPVSHPLSFTQDFSTDASGFIGDGISSGFMSVTGGAPVATAAATTRPP